MIEFIRNLVFRDVWLKLFSLALAILIWLTVSFAIHHALSPASALAGAQQQELTYSNIPLHVTATAADLDAHVYEITPNEVVIRIRGEPRLLQKLQPSEIRAFVDVTGLGNARGLQKRIEFLTPPGITLVQVTPDQAEVLSRPKH
ncbi:MAG: hypothetical protein U1F98_06425 [Verrucomicrobiota bacterium]